MAATGVMAFAQIGNAIAQSEAQKTQADFAESQAEINARFAEIEAADTIRRGNKAAIEHGKKVRQKVGSQKAALAAQGIVIDSGTAQDIQDDTAEIGALDVQTIKNNAWRQAFGFKQEAVSRRFQGQFDASASRFAAQNTLITGGLQAIGSGVQGAQRQGNK